VTLASAVGVIADFTASPNQPPTATIAQPGSGATFVVGNPVVFQGSATDPEEGSLSGSSLAWTSSIDGALGTGTTLTTVSLRTGVHTITLTATDSAGATGSASLTITIDSGNPTASISGRVTGNGLPIESATLTLSGPVSGSTSSNLNGDYSFTMLPAGTYTVTVSVALAVTFPNPSQTFSLGAGAALVINFEGFYLASELATTVGRQSIVETPASAGDFLQRVGELLIFTGTRVHDLSGAVQDHDVRRGGRLEGAHGSASGVVEEAAGHGVAFDVSFDLTCGLVDGDADDQELDPVTEALVRGPDFRFERAAEAAPRGPELDEDGLPADELREVDRVAIEVLDLCSSRRAADGKADVLGTRRSRHRECRRRADQNEGRDRTCGRAESSHESRAAHHSTIPI